jgi:hypothetical protein
MRGQKMARPIRVRAPSTTAKACSIVMSSGERASAASRTWSSRCRSRPRSPAP